ncbi:MAG: SDR family oxidoreductase [Candidatus Thermoplasmatota archaeon]|jgi:NAD(P)-dependent dehydrogenase (short-subunit alcohol dehydrogenase family)|nr:SDR family oxidoreductase [Candidatus Thermoplasmatota archaeon]MEC7151454.1 SDR family oxidoreductase [Candidatus Thermoplasmatota archaeon]MEC7411349.1 SDR family oxidoreductase [Candidatus Thermoplasmatota archaeon]MEC7722646.1 SDR family oxidoreductase [Candidatus Thermoplasmatota archaeon]MEC8078358.1 SDR family oxidoreductase [Candidatus Thermoplasmatota archaeon]
MASVLVVGASSDVAHRLIPELLAAGHTVTGLARDASRLAAFEHERFHAVIGDALDQTVLQDAVAQASAEEPVSMVAHLVGSIVIRPPHAMKMDQFNEVIATNLGSAFLTLSVCGKAMMRTGGGRMVFTSSVAAGLGLVNHEAIAAAKGGLEAMVRSAAATYAKRGLRINAVAPSLTETRLAEPMLRSEAARAASEAMVPIGRIGQPEEVATTMAWLLEGAPDNLTGEVLHVDGGMGRVRAMG